VAPSFDATTFDVLISKFDKKGMKNGIKDWVEAILMERLQVMNYQITI
jgi:hypothetical protein